MIKKLQVRRTDKKARSLIFGLLTISDEFFLMPDDLLSSFFSLVFVDQLVRCLFLPPSLPPPLPPCHHLIDIHARTCVSLPQWNYLSSNIMKKSRARWRKVKRVFRRNGSNFLTKWSVDKKADSKKNVERKWLEFFSARKLLLGAFLFYIYMKRPTRNRSRKIFSLS